MSMMEWLMISFTGLVSICLAYALAFTFNVLKYHPSLKPGVARLPTGSLGLPLLGETLEFLRCFKGGRPDLFWQRRSNSSKYKGLFRTHLLGQPTICVTTPKLATSVLMNDSLFGLGWPESINKLSGTKSFLSVSGEVHKRLRRLSAGSITSTNSLKCVLSDTQALTHKTLSSWAEKGEVAVVPEMLKLTFNIIAKIILSYEPGTEADAFGREVNQMALGLAAIGIDLPGTTFNRALKARRKVIVRLQSIINERRARMGDQSYSYSDILASLMEMKDEKELRGLEDDEIIDTVVAFLIAGHETHAHAMMWMLYFLQKHPQVLHKLKEEQQHLYELKGSGGSLSISDIKGMTYMSKVINETLRIVNLAPVTYRRALKNVELNDSTIPKGWTVQVWFRAIHLDPTIFANPHAFDPDRWTDDKPKMGAYIPFGAGSRSCLGADLAKLEISAIMYHLVQNYRWDPIKPNCKITYLPIPKLADGYCVKFFRIE